MEQKVTPKEIIDGEVESFSLGIKHGDIINLGRHRLMCGDSTCREDVEKLLNGVNVDCIFTDPPYCSGGFQESQKSQGSIGSDAKVKWGGQRPQIANDTLSSRGYTAMIKAVFERWPAYACYVFTDWKMWVYLFDAAEASGFGVRQMIVWDKGTPGMGMGWRAQHELLLFGIRQRVKFDNHKAQGNVIGIKRSGNAFHPTQKPLDLLEKVLNVSDWGLTVADPFGGSGSILMTCEKLNRTCYTMELSPAYCEVIIKRWEALTGEKAQLT